MKKILRGFLAVLMLALILVPVAALADGGETDDAGNQFFTETFVGKDVSLDLYGAGETVSVNGCTIGGSAILAGKDLSVNGSTIGGSLRAAAYTVVTGDTAIDANATVAAYEIGFEKGFTAKGVYAAAAKISFDGVCDTLNLTAEDISISGTVNGDAIVSAEHVSVLPGAVITGRLRVSSPNAPIIATGTSLGPVEFEKIEAETAEAVTFAAKALSFLKKLARSLPGAAVLAVIYFFTIGGAVEKSGEMLVKRPAPMLLSGLVALVAAPLAAIFLFISFIGAGAGCLVLMLYALALAFAGSFTGASLGRKFLPKLPGLAAAVIGAAALVLVRNLPIIGGLVGFAAILFTLGYYIQAIYAGFQKEPVTAGANAEEAPAEALAAPVPEAPETEKTEG